MRRAHPAHSDAARAIAEAAQHTLPPLGFRQKGRSALWVGDRGYWVVLVDFQRLAVGASWLWFAQSQLSFDYGARLEEDGPERLARRAAEKAAAVDAKFATIDAIAAHLVAQAASGPWPLYHAAVAAGLAGDAGAGALFARLAALPAARAWETELQAEGAALARRLDDRAAFRDTVAAIIGRMRARQGLPARDGLGL